MTIQKCNNKGVVTSATERSPPAQPKAYPGEESLRFHPDASQVTYLPKAGALGRLRRQHKSNLEKPGQTKPKVPSGTDHLPFDHQHHVVFKDSTNLLRPPPASFGMSVLKRRMSDPACCSSSILWESSDPRGRLSKQAKSCWAHDFGREKMDLYAKENDVCPHYAETIKEIWLEDQGSSPPTEGTSKLREISKTEHTFFTDLPTPNSADEASEDVVNKSTRYFSTPMASKTQQKKRLTPVMEAEVESSGHLTFDETCRQDVLQNEIANSETAASDSPKEPPLYRSFFASECQVIVSQLEGIEAERNILGKRKLDELDVSTIDAEPPPYDSTMMKSLLACEVTDMLSSLESSPNKDQESMFGESLLDLEKVDLQLHHFSLTEDLKHVHKDDAWKDCAVDGISLLGDLDDKVCSKKRQKLEQLCDENKHLSLDSPKGNSAVLNQTAESPVHRRDTDSEEESKTMFDNFTIEKGLETMSLILELESSNSAFPEDSVCNSSNVAKLHQFSKEAELSDVKVNSLGNTTKDLVFIHEELPADFENDTTDPKRSENILQSTVIIDHDNDAGNITQVIECTFSPSGTVQDHILQNQLVTVVSSIQTVPESANETHDLAEIQSIANTTLELVSASATHADVLVHGDVTTVEPITAMRTNVRLSPNTTHEIVSVHDEVTPANSTHVIEAVPSNSADATQEIIPVYFELMATNTTQVIEAGPIASANITQDFALTPAENSVSSVTQDIMLMDDEAIAANICLENVVPKIDAESSKDIMAALSVLASANTTQVIDDTEKPSDSSEQDSALMRGDNCAVSPTRDIVSAHEGNSTSTTAHTALTHKGNPVRTIQKLALARDGKSEVSSAQDVSSPVVFKDTILKEIRQSPQDKTSFTEKVHADPVYVTEPVPITLVTDIINISRATGSSMDHTIEVPPDHPHTHSPTHLTAEDVLPTSTLAQSKQEISPRVSRGDQLPVEDEKVEVTCNKKCDMVGPSGTLHSSGSKESTGEPGPCDTMQEAENIHDESVFSVCSFSFVTSTPVPGLNNFHFKNPCQDPMNHDSNLSLCSVGEPTEKAPVEQKPSTQQSSLETQSAIGNPMVKKDIPRGTFLYRGTQRNFLPEKEVSKLPPPASTISSARRSLALNTSSQKISKELVLPPNPPKAPGIPTRGVMRPPLNRNSILKTSMVNLKQGIGGTSGNILQSKLSGSRLNTPKVTPKAKCTSSSALSMLGSLMRPPSRLSVAGSGPLCAGSQRSNTAVQQTADGTTGSTTQPPAPSASRTSGLLKPRISSLRPPVPVQLQKSPPKTKSYLPGPPVRKFQRELPKAAPASTRNESGTTRADNHSSARAPKASLTVSPKPCSQLVTLETAGAKTNTVQAEKLVAESTGKTQSSSAPQGKNTLPAASAGKPPVTGDVTIPVSEENCSHLKSCVCCNKTYQQLLQEIKELKSCLEKVEPPAAVVQPTSKQEGSEERKPL